jgi:[ribosomal protein S5]-alanine N-acetyltransferase
MEMIHTNRLKLIPLTHEQLQAGLQSLHDLSSSVGVPIVDSLFDGIVQRAVTMKIEKMKKAPDGQHAWFTYWLIVIKSEKIGAGMVGYKGIPNPAGEVEIGYGIDEVFRSHGYMTEAVCALVDWAFSHPECSAVTATNVLINNFGSQKVLIKSGFKEISSDEKFINYRLERGLSKL